MPSFQIVRNAFNGGEISPRSYGRTDIPSVRVGSKQIRNLICTPQGGLTRRPGTRYVSNTIHSDRRSTLIPFITSTDTSYMMEFSDYRIRFYRDAGVLFYSSIDIEAFQMNVTANQFEFPGHGFYHGQRVRATQTPDLSPNTDYYVCLPQAKAVAYIMNAFFGPTWSSTNDTHYFDLQMGPYELFYNYHGSWNSTWSRVFISEIGNPDEFRLELTKGEGDNLEPSTWSPSGSLTLVPLQEAIVDTFRLSTNKDDLEGSIVPLTVQSAVTIGPEGDEIVEVYSPYTEEEAQTLQYAHSADVMYMFHEDHPPYELLRFNTSAFILQKFVSEDGPYGPLSPLGRDGTIEVVNGLVDLFEEGEVITSSTFFHGTDVGQPLRKRFAPDGKGLWWAIGRIEKVHRQVAFKPTKSFVVPKANFSQRQITILAHGLVDDEIVTLRRGDGDLPGDIDQGVPYKVQVLSADVISIKRISDDSLVLFETEGGTNHTLTSNRMDAVGIDTETPIQHLFEDGQDFAGIFALGTLPLGLNVGYAYKINVIDAGKFSLNYRDGTPAPVMSKGSGRFLISAAPSGGSNKAWVRWTIQDADGGNDGQSEIDIWQIGALGARRGWPGSGSFFEQRLVMGGSDIEPTRFWFSKSGDFYNFSLDEETGTDIDPGDRDRTITDASGITYVLVADRQDRIRWIQPATNLLMGTDSSIFEISASTQRQALTPTNINAEVVSREGASLLPSLPAGSEVVYVSQFHTKVLAASFDNTSEHFRPAPISSLADHIIGRGNRAISITFQKEPWSVIWLCRNDGVLWGCTFDRAQELAAWHHHHLGGSHIDSDGDVKEYGHVETVAVIPSPDGTYEQLWMVVRRQINGSEVRYIEYMDNRFDIEADKTEAYFVDSGPLSYDGVETTSVSGLGHLVGETVDVWADGATQPQKIVQVGGTISIGASSKVSSGLRFAPLWVSLPLEQLIDQTTTIFGLMKSIPDLYINLFRTLGGSVGTSEDDLEQLVFRTPTDIMDESPPLFSGRYDLQPPILYPDREAIVVVRVDGPEPFHMTHIVARLEHESR